MSANNRILTIAFDAIARYERLPRLRHVISEIAQSQFLPPERRQANTTGQLRRLLKHAYMTVPYYKHAFDRHHIHPNDIVTVSDLAHIPYLTKDLIVQHGSALISNAYRSDQIHSTTTGGTTGPRMVFARDNSCLVRKEGARLAFDLVAGWSIGTRVGLLWPAQIDYLLAPTWRAHLKNRLFLRTIMLPSYTLEQSTMSLFVSVIWKQKPVILRGFTSPLVLFAEHILASGKQLPSLRGVVSTGEPLYRHQRGVMQRAYGCRIYNMYGSRELGCVAQECDLQQGLHINEHGTIVECISPNDLEEDGELVCTDLYNYGMPFIRYRTGDFGRIWRTPCECGRGTARVANVEGRLADVFLRRDGSTIQPGALVLYLVDEAPGTIGQMQIIQMDYERFLIYVTDQTLVGRDLSEYHLTTLKRLFGDTATVSYVVVSQIQREVSGKVRFAKCLIGHGRGG